MKNLLMVIVSAVLVNNFVLSRFLGICPFLGVSKKLDTAMGMSGAVIFVMGVASAATWPIYHYLLLPGGMAYLQTLVFILVIAALVQFVEIILKRFMPPLYKALGIYLPLITTNCAVLGVTILNINENYSFPVAVVNSVAAGAGFMLALVVFSGVREQMEGKDIPRCMQGLPSALVAAGLVSLAFFGFKGLFA